MSAFNKNAKNLIYLVAAGFLIVGVLNLLAYWLKCRHDHTSLNPLRCLLSSIPLVIGALILVKSSALAQRIEDWLDE